MLKFGIMYHTAKQPYPLKMAQTVSSELQPKKRWHHRWQLRHSNVGGTTK
jgi:hypothetical protein